MNGIFSRTSALLILTLALTGSTVWYSIEYTENADWSTAELTLLRSLWLGSLEPLPFNPSNSFANDPRAAQLGHRLFFDTRFSSNGEVACASCHQPELSFTDGLPLSVGTGVTDRNAMSIVGSAYSPWYFWDGRKDSLWSQALAPWENPVEHGSSRTQIVGIVAADDTYRKAYESIFGSLPGAESSARYAVPASPSGDPEQQAAWDSLAAQDRMTINRVFANLGKALEAYQRLLQPAATRFDRYAEAVLSGRPDNAILSEPEIEGLRLFLNEAQCINCHNGPLFTNNDFHNTAVLSAPSQLPSKGRHQAVDLVLADQFNCLGEYSDAAPSECAELNFMRTGDELIGAHRTPSLRNVADTAPYMHNGQIKTLREALRQYSTAPEALVGHNEAKPLNLSSRQLDSLEAFLRSLSGPLATEPQWLMAP